MIEEDMSDAIKRRRSSNRFRFLMIFAAVVFITIASWFLLRSGEFPGDSAHNDDHSQEGHSRSEVALSPEALSAAGIETGEVIEMSATATLRVTGAIEANQEQTQQVTPLVAGRVERVYASLGDAVKRGAVLATISSPQIAELHGKLHEAETRFRLAEQNLERVQKAENRVSALQARARLDEAEANLNRTRYLVERGVGAARDLIAAETIYKTAKAEYDYHSNISLSREVQEARVEAETARVEVQHIHASLRALGAEISEDARTERNHDTSMIRLRAPVSGKVTERMVNAGAGVEAGKALFTISNISTVWVIASVPESQVGLLRAGTRAEVRSVSLGDQSVTGRVTYIDPILNEETRTARVRIEVANRGERLKVGMFAEVDFQTTSERVTEFDLFIPDEAVQRIGNRIVVFIPKLDEPGHFHVRDIEIGGVTNGQRRIIGGLRRGESVVTKGGFTLKTQLLKEEIGEGHQ